MYHVHYSLCTDQGKLQSTDHTHTTLGFRLRGFVSVRCRRAQRRRGPGRCCLLPAKPPEVGDEADVHVPLHLLRQRRQDLHCVTGLQFSRNRTRTTYFGCLARARYRFGDAAQDGLWHEAQGRRQDAGDGDLQVAPHPAPAAPAPVGVQRPAHAEVEAGWRVAGVQPPQLPLRLYKYKSHRSTLVVAGAGTRWEGREDVAGQAIRTTRRSSPPARCRSCMTTTGRTVRRRNCSGSMWTRHSPSPTRWLLLSSGNMARNTRARSWMYSSKETPGGSWRGVSVEMLAL
uniref:Uncharacterized protein n=1 Tax=Zea mays TaxID=4577 RepID=C4J0P8_MAIZE|nr:unknown [Zea mays]